MYARSGTMPVADFLDLTGESSLYCRRTLVSMATPDYPSEIHRLKKGAVVAVTDADECVRVYKAKSVEKVEIKGRDAPTIYIAQVSEIPYAKWPEELREEYNAPYGDTS